MSAGASFWRHILAIPLFSCARSVLLPRAGGEERRCGDRLICSTYCFPRSRRRRYSRNSSTSETIGCILTVNQSGRQNRQTHEEPAHCAFPFRVLGSSPWAVRSGPEARICIRAGRPGRSRDRTEPWRKGGEARQGRARGYLPGSVYAPYFYSDLGYDSGLGLDSADEPMLDAPPIVYREPYQAAAAPPKPVEGPVLLELQGDHWVRTAGNGPPQIVGQSSRPEPERTPNQSVAAPSAVLVFRDGHTEEIGKYCIMGANIRISTDYWSTGSWTQTVKIPDLDIPATLKLNQQRGTNFRLPSSPYEVMIGG